MFQYGPHLLFVRRVEPLNEVVDRRALCKVFRRGRTPAKRVPVNTQLPLTLPGTLSTPGHVLQSVISSPRIPPPALPRGVRSLQAVGHWSILPCRGVFFGHLRRRRANVELAGPAEHLEGPVVLI